MGNKLLLLLLLPLLPLLHAYSGESTVRYLPGYQGPLPFELETGYIGVGEAEESQFCTTSSNLREPQQKTLFLSG
ncbi:unnamed protein product [Brassica oleracea]|uniref:Uncharacterized protein n=1 Tax=Brassica oleracea TaxID=3712 RepID=A0A3P6AZK1_BRAOL|nr:unnamed protein product [Brassica oleracea]